MTFKQCDICGKELLDNDRQYLFRMDRVPESGPAITWTPMTCGPAITWTPMTFSQTQSKIEVTIPIHMDLCRECHDDLMAFLDTKKKGGHDYHD